ncbi:MAG: hypothetical protein AAF974_12155, partial [Cyanobacteria bacterium P01_E01_bin.34]
MASFMQAFLILIIVLAIAGTVAITGDRLIRAGTRGFTRYEPHVAPERRLDWHQRARKTRLMGWRATVIGIFLGAIVSLATWGAGFVLVHTNGPNIFASGSAVPSVHAVPANALGVDAQNVLAKANSSAALPLATLPLATNHSPFPLTISRTAQLAQATPNSSESAPQESNPPQNAPAQPNSAVSRDGEFQSNPLGRAEAAPLPQPSRWQRMQGFLFVFYILVLSG